MSATIDWDPQDALIFTRVVDEGSFTAAAKSLDLPKSTVSRRVSRLEESLGVQLLRRTTRRLSLTDPGLVFHRNASLAMEALSTAERAATSLLDVPQGRLRVTSPVELGTRPFKAILAFSRAHPEVQLDLELTNRYTNLVEEGYDVALRGGRVPEGSLTGRRLGLSKIQIVASPRYLEAQGRPRRAREVSQHQCVLFPSWVQGGAWTLTGPRGEVRIPVQGRLTFNNLEAVRIAALEDFGLALLPLTHCEQDLAAGTLVQVLPSLTLPSGGMWLVYSRTRFMSAKVRAFVDFMVAELGA
jgi:DNA-binding transcriptional LysR family regulator